MDENIYRAMEGYRQLLGRVEAMEAREGNREIRLSTLEAACRAELAARSQPAERAGVPELRECDMTEDEYHRGDFQRGYALAASRAQALAPDMVAIERTRLDWLEMREARCLAWDQWAQDELTEEPVALRAKREGGAG